MNALQEWLSNGNDIDDYRRATVSRLKNHMWLVELTASNRVYSPGRSLDFAEAVTLAIAGEE